MGPIEEVWACGQCGAACGEDQEGAWLCCAAIPATAAGDAKAIAAALERIKASTPPPVRLLECFECGQTHHLRADAEMCCSGPASHLRLSATAEERAATGSLF